MRASDYLSREELANVAGAEGTGAGAALLAACERECKRIEKSLATDAKINCEKIEDDVRYKLGAMSGLRFLERLRKCARAELGMHDDDGE